MRGSILSCLFLFAVFACPANAAPAPDAKPASRYDIQVDQARETMFSDPQQAFDAARLAERSAGTDAQSRARAIWLQAEALLRLSRVEPAEQRIGKAIDLIGDDPAAGQLRGELLLTRGGVEAQLGRFGQALTDYQQAHRLFSAAGDARKQSIVLSQIALLHQQGADYASALKYYRQALDSYDGDPIISVSVLNNRGGLLQDSGQPRVAIGEFTNALAVAEKVGSATLTARVLANMARAQLASGDVDAAARSLGRAALLAPAPREGSLTEIDVVSALVALERGETAAAANQIDGHFAGVDPQTTTLSSRAAHRAAYMIYERAGRDSDALVHLEALRRLDEQATEIATSTRAALMSARFDFANQELRIANLKAEELRRNVAFERSRARAQMTLFGVAGLAALLVLGLLIYNLVATRRSRNEIRAANAELEVTNVRLEKALAAKTEFLATTSHEIRTPLNGILGMTQVMLADGSVSGKMRDRIDVVHGAGLTMKALVDDILDVAKMETGHLTVALEPTDLVATLGEVTRMWEEQAHSKGLAFLLDAGGAPRWIETDPGRLRQIAFNLLANALKFTESGGITVRVTQRGEGDAARLVLAVRDTGIGIASDKQAQIFESFQQVDSGTTRKYGGTGLGLAICRNLARALGGDIHVDSIEGEGATFTLDMPLRLTEPPEGHGEGAGDAALLIVDRNPINRSMLRTLLESRAGKVRFASDVEHAVTALQAGGIGYVLVDDGSVRGGDADPIALVGKLAAAAAGVGARSALLWKAPSDEDRSRLRETAIDIVIPKPVAGVVIADALFGANGNPPLVSQAA